jgi:O-antigen ligase
MATLAMLFLPLLHPSYKRSGWKLAGTAVLTVAAYGVFQSTVFQERFFTSGSGTLEDIWHGDFSSSGRLEAWPLIWEKAMTRPWLGHGVNSATHFVPQVWPRMQSPHNEYIRIVFESGFIGLGLFLLAMIRQIADLRHRICCDKGTVRTAFVAVYLGLVIALVTSLTDNTFLYTMRYMSPLFVLLGAAYSVEHQIRGAQESLSVEEAPCDAPS